MKPKTVKDLLIPVSEYATVSEEATLYDAVITLEHARQIAPVEHYRHRAILVYDANHKIVGKVGQLDVLRALEPKYSQIGEDNPVARLGLSRLGLSPHFMKSVHKQLRLWNKPLDDICEKGSKMKVKNIMYTISEGEYVEEGASLDEAINQLVLGQHQSLLVTRDQDIIGILRLTDVFTEICRLIKTCDIS